MTSTLVLAAIAVVAGALLLHRSVRVVPQGSADVVERFGRHHRTLEPGLRVVVPFADRVRDRVDLRERAVPFSAQAVSTAENLVVSVGTVVYYQVTDAEAATYEVQDHAAAIGRLTLTALRGIVGGMDLERALASRDEIGGGLREVLDGAAGRWGVRVNRVELEAVDPPASIKEATERQMRADRDKRAAILAAEGHKQSAILTAEGERTSAVLRARGQAEAAVLSAEADGKAQAARARGQAQAISTVFGAIHEGKPDRNLLAYHYLQVLPKIAEGAADKVWIVPGDLERVLEGLGGLSPDAVMKDAVMKDAVMPDVMPNGVKPDGFLADGFRSDAGGADPFVP